MAEPAATVNIQEQITVRQSKEASSHTAGFEAWMRGRGSAGVQVFTADDVIDQFGVVKGSYDAVPLPRIRAHVVQCSGSGRPAEVLSVGAEDLPAELEWGQVLLSVRYAPINPADLYTVTTGGTYGQESVKPPFVPGHDAVGVVVKVRCVFGGVGDNLLFNVWECIVIWVPMSLALLEHSVCMHGNEESVVRPHFASRSLPIHKSIVRRVPG